MTSTVTAISPRVPKLQVSACLSGVSLGLIVAAAVLGVGAPRCCGQDSGTAQASRAGDGKNPTASAAQSDEGAGVKSGAPTDPAGQGTNPMQPPAKPLPGEVKPEVLLLPDKNGKLQTVPGFTLEDFTELYKLKQGLAEQQRRPRYHIKRLAIKGAASDRRADLEAELSIETRQAGWVRIPLHLGTATLLDEPKYKGEGKHELHLDDDDRGYVLWLDGDADAEHLVTLSIAVPLTQVGSERQLQLALPRATISNFDLSVDGQSVAARMPESGTFDTNTEGSRTRFRMSGVLGDMQLGWRPAQSAADENPTAFDVAGMVLVRFDQRSVGWDANLAVRSYGAAFDRFFVRLPRGAVLLPAAQAGMTVTPAAASPDHPQVGVVEVKLEKKTSGPVEVRLLAERQRNAEEDDQPAELSGFDVVNALRQRGSIAVQIIGNWQVMWGESQNVRQVDELPEGLRREDVAAGFNYFVQPYSLSARIVPQRTRLTVDPEYIVLIGPHRVQLQAKLRYMVRGAKVRNLEILIPGWEIDRVGPANLLDTDAPVAAPGGRLTVALAQPTAGEVELSLEAHRDIESSAEMLDVELPQPQAESLTPAIVAIVPADDVELTPRAAEVVGLSPVAGKPALTLPERQQEPMVLRVEKPPARFVADFKVHQQQISTEVFSQVQLDQDEIQVDQRYSFQVAYVPVDRVAIALPASVAVESIRASLDGQSLSPTVARDDAASEQAARVSFPLSRPRLGRFELQVNYRIPQSKLLPAATVTVAVPLGMPRGEIARNTAIVKTARGISAAPMKGDWTVDVQSGASERLGGVAFSSKRPQVELPLAVTLQEGPPDGSTVVQRAWLQTWLTDRVRQDRAVYRFRSTESEARLVLPDGASVDAVEVWLNGRPAASTSTKTRELVIPLDATADADQILELRYQFPDRPALGRARFEAPRWKPALWVRQFYWQLIVPSNEHLLRTPTNLTSEFTWRWNGLFWEREPALLQRDLEHWAGSKISDDVPQRLNKYLFSVAGGVDSLTVSTARRSTIVFVTSLGVMLIGLSVIYFPKLLHPLPLVLVAGALAVGSIIEPETTLVVAQAAGLGVALVVVAFVLSRKSFRKFSAPVTPSASSPSLKDRSATELYHRPAKAGPPPSTATAPMAVQASTADVEV